MSITDPNNDRDPEGVLKRLRRDAEDTYEIRVVYFRGQETIIGYVKGGTFNSGVFSHFQIMEPARIMYEKLSKRENGDVLFGTYTFAPWFAGGNLSGEVPVAAENVVAMVPADNIAKVQYEEYVAARNAGLIEAAQSLDRMERDSAIKSLLTSLSSNGEVRILLTEEGDAKKD